MRFPFPHFAAKHPFLFKAAVAGLGGVLWLFLVFVGAFLESRWLSWTTAALLGGAVLGLLFLGVFRLLKKRWISGLLSLVAAVVLVPAGLAAFFLTALGAQALSQADLGRCTLPVVRAGLRKKQDRGLFTRSHLMARGIQDWRTCEVPLPEDTVLTYYQKSAHPFLAEYDMRLRIAPKGEPARRFVLPMNTGGRTAILVSTGRLADGTPAVRLDAGQHFNLAFRLRDLRWVSVADPEAESLLQQARDYFLPGN